MTPSGRPTRNIFAAPRIDALPGLLESYNELQRLQDRPQALRLQLEAARRYLGMPGSNRRLAQAQLERVRARYSATLAGLRFARHEAHRRLGLATPAGRQSVA